MACHEEWEYMVKIVFALTVLSATLLPFDVFACGYWKMWDTEMGWKVRFDDGATHVYSNKNTKIYRVKRYRGKTYSSYRRKYTIHNNNADKKNYVNTRRLKNQIKIRKGKVLLEKKVVGSYSEGFLKLEKQSYKLDVTPHEKVRVGTRFKVSVTHMKKTIMKGKARPLCRRENKKLQRRDVETRLVLYFVWRKHLRSAEIEVKRTK